MNGPALAEIVRDWLDANGYDGLVGEEGCSCWGDDLMACGEPSDACAAGNFVDADCPRCEVRNDGVCGNCDRRAIG